MYMKIFLNYPLFVWSVEAPKSGLMIILNDLHIYFSCGNPCITLLIKIGLHLISVPNLPNALSHAKLDINSWLTNLLDYAAD